jgi:hypothetical protein
MDNIMNPEPTWVGSPPLDTDIISYPTQKVNNYFSIDLDVIRLNKFSLSQKGEGGG